MMSRKRVQHAVMVRYNMPPFIGKAEELQTELQKLHESLEYSAASPAARARADAAHAKKVAAIGEAFLNLQRPFVEAARARWRESNPQTLQLKAAADDPARVAAIRTLAEMLSEAEQCQLGEQLKRAGDAAGAFGLRRAAKSDAVTSLALEAGTSASRGKLVDLLLTQQAWAASVTAVGLLTGAPPEAGLTAANEAGTISFPDGSTRTFTERELDELLGEDDASP
jgi:hypothetical protein